MTTTTINRTSSGTRRTVRAPVITAVLGLLAASAATALTVDAFDTNDGAGAARREITYPSNYYPHGFDYGAEEITYPSNYYPHGFDYGAERSNG